MISSRLARLCTALLLCVSAATVDGQAQCLALDETTLVQVQLTKFKGAERSTEHSAPLQNASGTGGLCSSREEPDQPEPAQPQERFPEQCRFWPFSKDTQFVVHLVTAINAYLQQQPDDFFRNPVRPVYVGGSAASWMLTNGKFHRSPRDLDLYSSDYNDGSSSYVNSAIQVQGGTYAGITVLPPEREDIEPHTGYTTTRFFVIVDGVRRWIEVDVKTGSFEEYKRCANIGGIPVMSVQDQIKQIKDYPDAKRVGDVESLRAGQQVESE